MENIKFGLLLTAIPFIVIFQFICIWWALADIAVRKIKGPKRAFWTLLAIILPPVGPLLYTYLSREREREIEQPRTPVPASAEAA
ncbi:MAG: hypothetical protein HYV06_10660 [Deltaproteobacteria bacterium]|nr:hypothetical protein [Deltaproteobacteria bacterium]